jgi:hypothetical protein
MPNHITSFHNIRDIVMWTNLKTCNISSNFDTKTWKIKQQYIHPLTFVGVDAYMDMERHMCFVHFLCPYYLICWANPSLSDTTMNHITKIQGKVNLILIKELFFNWDLYYWFALHGLCVSKLCMHYGKIIDTYIGYTSNIFVFMKCS